MPQGRDPRRCGRLSHLSHELRRRRRDDNEDILRSRANLVRQLAIAEGTSRTSGTVLAFGAPRGCRGQSAQFLGPSTPRTSTSVNPASASSAASSAGKWKWAVVKPSRVSCSPVLIAVCTSGAVCSSSADVEDRAVRGPRRACRPRRECARPDARDAREVPRQGHAGRRGRLKERQGRSPSSARRVADEAWAVQAWFRTDEG
jgi:hypothetical protein